MKYRDFSLNDFVTDEYFIKWVKNPDTKSDFFWTTWIKENPDKKELIEEASEIVRFLNFTMPEPSEEDFNEVKNKLFQRIKEDKEAPSSQIQPSNAPNNPFKSSHQKMDIPAYYKVAAVFIGLLVVVGLSLTLNTSIHYKEYKTAYGETQEIVLPDSSTVTLNANSSLKLSTNWEENEIREVWLEGEAFFNVREVSDLSTENGLPSPIKFIVRVNSLNVEVIGTKFNVNNRRGTTEVVLKSGKVKLQVDSNQSNIEMLPGEFVEFKEVDRSFNKRIVEPETYSSWRNNKLIFENQPLHEIFKIVEDHYGFEIVLEDPKIAHLVFTGTTPLNNVDVLFTSISHSFDLEIKRENKRIIVSNNAQNTHSLTNPN